MTKKWDKISINEIKSPARYSLAMGPFGSNIKTDNFVPDGVPIIRGGNLSGERFNDIDFVFLTEEKADELKSANAFSLDIVFTHRGTLGQVGIIPKKSRYPRYVVSQSQMKLTCDQSKVDPYFVFYFFKSYYGRHALLSNTSTTGVPAISQPLTSLKKIELPFPSLTEQRTIANILRSLDDKIELNRQMNEMLEAISRAIFQSWFVDFDPVRAKAEGRDTGLPADVAELFPDGFEVVDGREIPRGWKIQSLNHCLQDIFDYRGRTPKKLGDTWSQEGIIAISAKNIKNGELINLDNVKYVSDGLYKKWMKSDLNTGDILMTSEAPMGELFYFAQSKKMCLSQRIFCIRANPKVINPALLYLSLNSSNVQSELRSRETGTTVTGIRQSLLRTIPVLVPPLNLQGKIASSIESLLLKINSNSEQSHTLTQIRDALLPKLMSGEVSVSIGVVDT
jgi:type I restriction enzyme S subunit